MRSAIVLFVTVYFALVNSAAIESDDVEEEGLYSKKDHVIILTGHNFDKKVYGQNHAHLVQFYNSFCGHCRKFAPKFKRLAADMVHWSKVVRPAVIDCNAEDNVPVCRDFDIMAYPTMRYLHENFRKGGHGDRIQAVETTEKVKAELIAKLESEQSEGRLAFVPSLASSNFNSLTTAVADLPKDTKFTFIIFEGADSLVGTEVILNINDYRQVMAKRTSDTSPLAPSNTPALMVITKNLETIILTPQNPTAENILNAINAYLKSKHFEFPDRKVIESAADDDAVDISKIDEDVVYLNDLEAAVKTALHNEVTRYKILNGERLLALVNFLDVLIGSFPFKSSNGRDYIIELRDTITSKIEWNGSDLYDLIKQLETKHAPVYVTNQKFVACKGSQTRFRGYSCSLWTLFHTLTVNAAQLPGAEGPRVLRAMHGYIKNFFGCTECSEHFQAMAARNLIFDVKENDKAILWLWISHNEVNLRLAGDETEDPDFPKIQFPSATRCPDCRHARGAWALPAVLRYLTRVYAADNVRQTPAPHSAPAANATPAPFSTLDYGMLSLLASRRRA